MVLRSMYELDNDWYQGKERDGTTYGCFRYDYNGRNWMRCGDNGVKVWEDRRTEKRILRSIWNCRDEFIFPKDKINL